MISLMEMERGVHTMDGEGNEYDLSEDGEKGNVEQYMNGEHNEENNLEDSMGSEVIQSASSDYTY